VEDRDYEEYMVFWRADIDNGTLVENVNSLWYVRESDECVWRYD